MSQPIRAAQLVYTRVEPSYSPIAKSGYQTMYCSAELSPQQVAQIEPRVQCFQPFSADVRRLQFFRLDDGMVVLSQSRTVTPWPDLQAVVDRKGRTGTFVAHCLVLSPEALLQAGGDPIALLGSRHFTADLPALLMRYGNPAQFEQLHGCPNGIIPALELRPATDTPAESSGWEGDQRQQLLTLALHAETLRQQGKSLALVGEQRDILATLREAFAPLSFEQRLGCGFDSCTDRCAVTPGQLWAYGMKERPDGAGFVQVDAGRRRVVSTVELEPIATARPVERPTAPVAVVAVPVATPQPTPPAPAAVPAPTPAVATLVEPAVTAVEPVVTAVEPAVTVVEAQPDVVSAASERPVIPMRRDVQPEHRHVVALIDRAMSKGLPLPREAQKDEGGCREFLRVYPDRVEATLALAITLAVGSERLAQRIRPQVAERLSDPVQLLDAVCRRSLRGVGLGAIVFDALLHERPRLRDSEWAQLQELAQQDQHQGLLFLSLAAPANPDRARLAEAARQLPGTAYRRVLECYGAVLSPALLVGGTHTPELAAYLQTTRRRLSASEALELFEAILRSGTVAPLDALTSYIPALDGEGRRQLQKLFATYMPTPLFRRLLDEAVAADQPQKSFARFFRQG